MNIVRSQVYRLFTRAISKLKPVDAEGNLNPEHLLNAIYTKYITAPTETDPIEKADQWLQRIYDFENGISNNNTQFSDVSYSWLQNNPQGKIVTEADDIHYNQIREIYPSNINLIAESVISPVNLSADDTRTPAIFYRMGAVRPHFGEGQTNTRSETITLIIYAVIKDTSENEKYKNRTLFTASNNLTDALYNAVIDIKSDDSARYGGIEVEFVSRPLREGTGSGEIIRFDISITYDYYISRLTQ